MDFFKLIGRWISRFFIFLGIIFFIFIFSITLLVSKIIKEKKKIVKKRSDSVLIVDFSTISGDTPKRNILESSFDKNISVYTFIKTLKQAENDPSIKGLIASTGNLNLSYAQISEIREALKSFKEKKPAYFVADTFSDGNNTKTYYLASAFSKIYMQPGGELLFLGIGTTSTFLKGVFEKLKVEPMGGHRKKYKTYWNIFTEKKYTPEHKESVKKMIDSIFLSIINKISKDRKIPKNKLITLSKGMPLFATDALKEKMIDKIGFSLDAWNDIKKNNSKLQRLSIFKYSGLKSLLKEFNYSNHKKIALIFADGEIFRGESEKDFMGNYRNIGSKTFVKAILSAANTKDVKGIIIRVNSPGGSAVASESIWHAILMAKKKKPVYISMGSYAASGGYYIAMAGNKIFADSETLTGSIGVVAGKLYTKKFWNMLGFSFDSYSTGKNTMVFSQLESFNDEQKEYLKKSLDKFYNDFVSRVASARKLTFEEAEKVAQGRVWTGIDAKNNHLIDSLGTLQDTIIAMKKDYKLKNISIEFYPKTSRNN